MKFARVADYYFEALRFLDKVDLSTNEIKSEIINSRIGLSNYITAALQSHGIEAKEFIFNSKVYSQRYSQEQARKIGALEICLEELEKYKPDYVLLNIEYPENLNLEEFRKRIPSIKKIFGWKCVAISQKQLEILKQFDSVFTCTPGFRNYYIENKIDAHLMPFGYSDQLNSIPIKSFQSREIGVNFSGSFIIGKNIHGERINFLNELLQKVEDVQIYGDRTFGLSRKRTTFFEFLLFFKKLNLLDQLNYSRREELDLFEKLIRNKKKFQPAKFGIEMLNLLSNSKIVINKHIDSAGDWAGNMRMFEATGMGACLLTDNKKNLNDIFKVGEEVMAYDSPDDCIEKITWLKNNENIAEKIALNGMKKTRTTYNYNNRVLTILDVINR